MYFVYQQQKSDEDDRIAAALAEAESKRKVCVCVCARICHRYVRSYVRVHWHRERAMHVVCLTLLLQAEEEEKAQKAMETMQEIHHHRLQMVSCAQIQI